MNKLKCFLPFVAMLLMLASCETNNLIDTNESVADNNWTYAKSAKAVVEIKDVNQSYNIYFKLRHTADYRYANLFVLANVKGNGLKKSTRYQFKLAKADGEWLGKGSGDIYTNNFSLLTNYRFAKPGKYEIEIEQNMRDNPLVGISDLGIIVERAEENKP
ncbi:MAG: gliding motility lipoprotein GldH [Flavobacterium sp.]|nr:MAG: gliding motility lipoprotein GldH [Flavobacterium sp.]